MSAHLCYFPYLNSPSFEPPEEATRTWVLVENPETLNGFTKAA
jgi:hypothetical protein